MTETAASLRQTAESLSALASAVGAQAEVVGGMTSAARTAVDAVGTHWGGPAAQAVLGAGIDYLTLVAPTVGALESIGETVRRWSISATEHADRLAIQEATISTVNHLISFGREAESDLSNRQRAVDAAVGIRSEWAAACTAHAGELSEAITMLFRASTAVAPVVDAAAASDATYFPFLAQLAVTTGLDASTIDPDGDLERAIAGRAAFLGGEGGAWIFALIETSNQGDIGKADGNLSEDDIIAACDAATVRALLLQVADEQRIEFDADELDALVAEVVGTAWMMRSSENEVWEDIDDDVEWYERGVFKFVREEVFAPVSAFAVGGACMSAAGVGTVVTGGAAAPAIGFCGGLGMATYNAADTWAHGGGGWDVLDEFTSPEAWALGAASSLALYGATSYLLRTPAVAPAASAGGGMLDDAYHYTFRQYTSGIMEDGLLIRSPGARIYTTPNSGLSPLQAHIELALPPNTGLRNAVIQIDLAGMRAAGYEIPAMTRVSSTVVGGGGRVYAMPGGGYEVVFDYPIPPEFLKVVVG